MGDSWNSPLRITDRPQDPAGPIFVHLPNPCLIRVPSVAKIPVVKLRILHSAFCILHSPFFLSGLHRWPCAPLPPRQISHSEKFDNSLAQKGLARVSQLTLYNAARPPPGPPELRRLRSVGRVPPPGILRRFTPPELRPQRRPRRLPPEGGEPGTPPSGGR